MHRINAVNHQCEETVTELGTTDTGTCRSTSIITGSSRTTFAFQTCSHNKVILLSKD